MADAAQLTGLAIHGIQLGVQAVLFKPARRIADFVAQVTIEESHVDELEITEHPVEQGAQITDHAYARPSELTIQAGWSNSPSVAGFFAGISAGVVTGTQAGINDLISGNGLTQANDIYQKLLELQTSRVPFTVVTGRRTYENMLFKSLRITTNKETENSLIVTAQLRQLILVQTQVVNFAVPASAQTQSQVTQPITNQGTKQLAPGVRFNATFGALAMN